MYYDSERKITQCFIGSSILASENEQQHLFFLGAKQMEDRWDIHLNLQHHPHHFNLVLSVCRNEVLRFDQSLGTTRTHYSNRPSLFVKEVTTTEQFALVSKLKVKDITTDCLTLEYCFND